MMSSARRATDHEILGHSDPDEFGSIELGTVGWAEDEEHFELGETDNGSVTLVKVTLLRGRPDSKPRILARVSGPLWYIPDQGAQVIVAIPAGFARVTGAACIIAVPGQNPTIQFGTNGGKNAVLDFGPDRRVIIKAGQGAILSDYENRYLGVGPDLGIKAGDADGSGFCLKDSKALLYVAEDGAATATMQLAKNDVRMSCTDNLGQTMGYKFKQGVCTVMCQQYANMAGGGQLGGGASPVSGIQYGPGIGVPSTTWRVQS